MKAKTFVTWKLTNFGYMKRGKNFWQLRLGIVIVSRMPADSKAVQDWRASHEAR